jgi:aspartyl-tRNA(Asn)/glutamyl-tRNA(Gln) amidotransferase subunit C
VNQSLDESAVRHVAHLSRLTLSDAEVECFAGQLGAILDYVAQLNELDTQDVPPTAHAVPLANVLRDDRPSEGLSAEQALVNAPDRDGDFFRVPRVLNQESA